MNYEYGLGKNNQFKTQLSTKPKEYDMRRQTQKVINPKDEKYSLYQPLSDTLINSKKTTSGEEVYLLEKKIKELEAENSELKKTLKLKEEIIVKKSAEISSLEAFLKRGSSSLIDNNNNIPIIDHDEVNMFEDLALIELADPCREYEDRLIDELCPDPDHMTYDQLIELQEKMGSVSRGLKKSDFNKLSKSRYTKKETKEEK